MQTALALVGREAETSDSASTLLIVEDDDALRNRLTRAMTRRGFEPRSASSVAEGLVAIEANPPEFAIVDLRLLDGSGLSVVEALNSANPNSRAIILTGYGNIPTAVAAARIGAVDYIAKPATADEIVDVLLTPAGETTPPPDDPIKPEEARRAQIEHVYHESGENISHTARLLNMHRRTLQRILKRNGMTENVAR